MLLRVTSLFLVIGSGVLVTSACGGTTATSSPDGGKPVVGDDTAVDSGAPELPDSGPDRNDAPVTCLLGSSSTLPHVRIVFGATNCVFTLAEVAAKIAIPYDLVVDEDVPGFEPASPYFYGSSAANLVLNEGVTGGGQGYCLCDQGLPAPQCPLDDGGLAQVGGGSTGACPTVTLPAGTYQRSFTWDGRNWGGPSDTDNPEGPPFPPGDYELDVSTAPGSIDDAGALSATAKLRIRIVP